MRALIGMPPGKMTLRTAAAPTPLPTVASAGLFAFRLLAATLGALLAVAPASRAAGAAAPGTTTERPAAPPATDEIKLLDPTNIEGEIRLPQVLFITSHESVRPLDFLEYYAAHAAAAHAGAAAGPGVIHVIRTDLRGYGSGAGQPGQPGSPGVPAVPGVPAPPATPAIPAVPGTPAVPAVPGDPGPAGATTDQPSIRSSTDHRSDTSGAAGRRASQEGKQP